VSPSVVNSEPLVLYLVKRELTSATERPAFLAVLTGYDIKFFDICSRREYSHLLWKNSHEGHIAVLHYRGEVVTTERLSIGTVCAINYSLFTLLFNGLRSNKQTVKAYCHQA